jgi:hypothetical protein
MATPVLIRIALPFAQRPLALGLGLVALFLLFLLIAATPFLIAVLVWRIKQRLQGKHAIEI